MKFILLVTALALLSVTDGYTQSGQRFGFKHIDIATTDLKQRSNLPHSLQSVLEDKESDFTEVNENSDKAQSPIEYDWKKQWYAVTYDFNLPTVKDKKPLSYSIFDQELTFWRDEQGVIRCSEDKCPHRNARLSEGKIDRIPYPSNILHLK